MHGQTAQPQRTGSGAGLEDKRSSAKTNRSRSVTIGFPAQREHETKKVHFDPPRCARLVNPDGSEIAECEVTAVWEGGAQLRLDCPPPFRFVLQFAWSPTVVSRFCKRVRCRGEDVWVEYERQRPCYSLEYDR
jgi:hypothetical protein